MHDADRDLTPRERAEFAALPRERDPGRVLEERTVKALRSRGLLHTGRFGRPWYAAAAAAAVALFAIGFAAGQWTSTREVADSLVQAQQVTAMEAARTVQRTGTAYVMALTALARLSDSAAAPAVVQGREAALAALYAAAGEMVALAPDDPIAGQIRRLLTVTDSTRQNAQDTRRVVWF